MICTCRHPATATSLLGPPGGGIAQPLPHRRDWQAEQPPELGWEPVTDCAVRALNNRVDEHGKPKPLAAILWGRNAQTLEPLLTNAAIIKSAHPSPLSASRGFFGSHPFSRANAALKQMGAEPVDWSLPSSDCPAR